MESRVSERNKKEGKKKMKRSALKQKSYVYLHTFPRHSNRSSSISLVECALYNFFSRSHPETAQKPNQVINSMNAIIQMRNTIFSACIKYNDEHIESENIYSSWNCFDFFSCCVHSSFISPAFALNYDVFGLESESNE